MRYNYSQQSQQQPLHLQAGSSYTSDCLVPACSTRWVQSLQIPCSSPRIQLDSVHLPCWQTKQMHPFSKSSLPLDISHDKIDVFVPTNSPHASECSTGFCGNLPAQRWVWETSREKVNTIECREEKALNFSVVFLFHFFF